MLIEFMKRSTVISRRTSKLLPQGGGWLIVEFGGDTRGRGRRQGARGSLLSCALARIRRTSSSVNDVAEQKQIWKVREAGLGSTAFVPHHPDAWEGWEDSAVPPERLGVYLRELKGLFDKYGYDCPLYGHFGDGCVHCAHRLRPAHQRRLEQVARLPRRGGRPGGRATAARSRASTATASRRPSCCRSMFGPELIEAFREFKAHLGPGREDEPRQGGRSLPASRRTCAWAQLQAARDRRRTSTSPTTTAASPAPPCAASASASAAGAADGDVCARATG